MMKIARPTAKLHRTGSSPADKGITAEALPINPQIVWLPMVFLAFAVTLCGIVKRMKTDDPTDATKIPRAITSKPSITISRTAVAKVLWTK
jgi:hypothetical protein